MGKPRKFHDASHDKLSTGVHSNHSPNSVTGTMGYGNKTSHLVPKVAYHSHYLDNEGSPDSFVIDVINNYIRDRSMER